MIKTGDTVRLSIKDRTFEAEVILASENGRSLMLTFDGSAPVGHGFVLGSLPVLQEDNGTWIEIIGGSPVQVEEL